MPIAIRTGGAALLLALLAGCATTGAPAPGDPLEGWNRGVHRVNDAIDRGVLKPVAKAYRRGVPQPVRAGIGNLLSHLAFPVTIANDLLQGKFVATAQDLGRFALNSTLGLGGLLDPASEAGLPRNEEDFGQTLGRWGVPAGPYLMLPLLGPSTLRDAPAMLADAQADLRVQLEIKEEERAALGVLAAVDGRARLLAADPALDAAFDRYAFIRNAWLQRREYQVKDGDVPDEVPPQELEDPEEPGDLDETEQPAVQPAASAPISAPTSPSPASTASAGGGWR
ncbi:MAG: MlaA family lipoprotein [Gammaproteobacteria bacterium]